MKTLLKRIWIEDPGILTFEWVLLITVLIIGIVGGLSAVRDAIIDELGDVAGAVVKVDQSYTVTACDCDNEDVDPCLQVMANSFEFQDSLPDCASQFGEGDRGRGENPGQGPNSGCNN